MTSSRGLGVGVIGQPGDGRNMPQCMSSRTAHVLHREACFVERDTALATTPTIAEVAGATANHATAITTATHVATATTAGAATTTARIATSRIATTHIATATTACATTTATRVATAAGATTIKTVSLIKTAGRRFVNHTARLNLANLSLAAIVFPQLSSGPRGMMNRVTTCQRSDSQDHQ